MRDLASDLGDQGWLIPGEQLLLWHEFNGDKLVPGMLIQTDLHPFEPPINAQFKLIKLFYRALVIFFN